MRGTGTSRSGRLAALGLDQVWLLVSPGNPLKPARGMAPFATRLASARRVADGRRVVATGIEARLGTRYTVDTLALLRHRFPRARFALLLGADNLDQLPRWRRWREIARTTPIAVVPRPGATRRALAGKATRVLGRHRRRPGGVAARSAGRARALVPDPGAGASGVGDRHPRAARAAAARGRIEQRRKTGGAHRAHAESPRGQARSRSPGGGTTPFPPRRGDQHQGPVRRRTGRRAARRAGPMRRRTGSNALVAAARTSLEDDKADDIQVLDVTGRASFTDRMVIATGQVERQLQAMATHLEDALEKAGLKLRRDAIQASPDWVLIDAGDLVVHLFRPEARATYALERMWGPDSPVGEAQPERRRGGRRGAAEEG